MRVISAPPWFPSNPDWLRHRSRGELRIAGLVAIAVCFVLLQTIHWLLVPNWNVLGKDCVPDIIASIIIGLLFSKIMMLAWDRRQRLQQRLDMIGEMNHHIRNALEVIQFSAHETHDPEAISRIQNASDRIQWALREILPNEICERRNHPSKMS